MLGPPAADTATASGGPTRSAGVSDATGAPLSKKEAAMQRMLKKQQRVLERKKSQKK